MKIAAISDIHGSYRQLPKLSRHIDTIIVAGDFMSRGKLEDVPDFINWLSDLPIRNKICIAGNHDLCFESEGYTAPAWFYGTGINYLKDSGVTIDGIEFWGSPWTPTFYDWAFMASEIELQNFWDKIPVSTNVLVTHGPPKGILDLVSRGVHAGSESLASTLANMRNPPRVHIFGHLHESGGRSHVGPETVSYNVAALDEYYVARHNPWTFLEI